MARRGDRQRPARSRVVPYPYPTVPTVPGGIPTLDEAAELDPAWVAKQAVAGDALIAALAEAILAAMIAEVCGE